MSDIIDRVEKYVRDSMSICDSVINTYERNTRDIKLIEDEQNDLIHEISLGTPKDVLSGYKIYKRLRTILQDRYRMRDENDTINEFYEFCLTTQSNRDKYNKMYSNISSEIEKLENRKYRPRVREDLTMDKVEVEKGKNLEVLLTEYRMNKKERKNKKYL